MSTKTDCPRCGATPMEDQSGDPRDWCECSSDPMEAASHVLDRMAARLEILAGAWRSEAHYMRNGDHEEAGIVTSGQVVRYIDASRASLLRGLANEANAIVRVTHAELDDITLAD